MHGRKGRRLRGPTLQSPNVGGCRDLKITLIGVIPAMSPITVALAPRLSAYRKIGLSIMIWHDRKLRKNPKRLWAPSGKVNLTA